MKSKISAAIVIITVLMVAVLTTVLILSKSAENGVNDGAASSDKDLSEFYDDVHISTSPVIVSQYTDSIYVDSAIDSLKTDNQFTEVVVLESWYDNLLELYYYYVLFDGSTLYCLIEDNAHRVYIDL